MEDAFHYKFRKPAGFDAIDVWPGARKTQPRSIVLEGGYKTLGLRWPVEVLDDHECDEAHRVAREIVKALGANRQKIATHGEMAFVEEKLTTWICKRRKVAALKAHED